jgi:hypothetical protein
MSEHYVSAKLHEALQATGGDKRDAQKLLITWAVRDPALLLGLTKPHLKAICAAAIDHTADSDAPKSAGKDEGQFSKKDIAAMIAGKPLGEKRTHAAPPPKSSERQATVMQQLADAFKKKKDR